MDYNLVFLIFLISSLFFLFASVSVAIIYNRVQKKNARLGNSTRISPFGIFIFGLFIAIVVLYLPTRIAAGTEGGFVDFAISVYSAMQLFLLNGSFDAIKDALTVSPEGLNEALLSAYTAYSALLFVVAPALTATFVLSFFKNAFAYLCYALNLRSEIYYFSELNEQSITLAENIVSDACRKVTAEDSAIKDEWAKMRGSVGNALYDRRIEAQSKRHSRAPLIVFFGVGGGVDAAEEELRSRARGVDAVLFKKDITSVFLKKYLGIIKRSFFLISENEDRNIKDALSLIGYSRKSDMLNTPLSKFYVFSKSEDGELLLDKVDFGYMKVRRVDVSRCLAINTVLENNLFKREGEDEPSVLIVGGGDIGVELFRMLGWCASVPGRSVKLSILDEDSALANKLLKLSPELLSKEAGGERVSVFGGVDVLHDGFSRILDELGRVTAAVVALGDDRKNVEAAIALRRAMKLFGMNGDIFAVVKSEVKSDTLRERGGLCRFGDASLSYGISFIGSTREVYTLGAIENEALETVGKMIHMAWVGEAEQSEKLQTFEKNEYFRRSSISCAIYIKTAADLGYCYFDAEDNVAAEHFRWNAFMRSEGYRFGEKKDHIAKTHPDLVPFERLSESAKNYDRSIIEYLGDKARRKKIEALFDLYRK